jgi:hypothetical protein
MSLTWSGDPHELRQLAAAIEQLRATAARGLPPAPDCETAISPPQEKGAGVASLAPADSAPAGLAEFEVVDPRQSDAASSASAVDVWQECEVSEVSLIATLNVSFLEEDASGLGFLRSACVVTRCIHSPRPLFNPLTTRRATYRRNIPLFDPVANALYPTLTLPSTYSIAHVHATPHPAATITNCG